MFHPLSSAKQWAFSPIIFVISSALLSDISAVSVSGRIGCVSSTLFRKTMGYFFSRTLKSPAHWNLCYQTLSRCGSPGDWDVFHPLFRKTMGSFFSCTLCNLLRIGIFVIRHYRGVGLRAIRMCFIHSLPQNSGLFLSRTLCNLLRIGIFIRL